MNQIHQFVPSHVKMPQFHVKQVELHGLGVLYPNISQVSYAPKKTSPSDPFQFQPTRLLRRQHGRKTNLPWVAPQDFAVAVAELVRELGLQQQPELGTLKTVWA